MKAKGYMCLYWYVIAQEYRKEYRIDDAMNSMSFDEMHEYLLRKHNSFPDYVTMDVLDIVPVYFDEEAYNIFKEWDNL